MDLAAKFHQDSPVAVSLGPKIPVRPALLIASSTTRLHPANVTSRRMSLLVGNMGQDGNLEPVD